MEDITVVIVDNFKDNSWILENRLTSTGTIVIGRFTHEQFVREELAQLPDIAIVALDGGIEECRQTIYYIKEKFPSIKIVVNSSIYDQQIIQAVTHLGIHGMIFEAIQNQEDLIKGVLNVFNGKDFFALE